ncbi:MAG: 2-dehydro-3-deoxyphosphogluconate aldolase, partial [Microbacterium sp.]
MTDNSAFHDIFGGVRLMAILRGMGVERSLAVATRAWDLGITAVEVPVQTPTDVEALRVVAEAARERGLTVGAGTV